MPLLKAEASKSKPNKAIAYITREDKAKFVDSLGLDNFRSYDDQFKETSNIFHINSKSEERNITTLSYQLTRRIISVQRNIMSLTNSETNLKTFDYLI